MVRIKAAVARKAGRKKVFKQAKGQFGHRKKRYSQAIRSVIKGMTYSFRDRKAKKREFKALWIARINAACRELGLSYSRFMDGLTKANVAINRKLLAELAVSSPAGFKKLVSVAKEAKA